MVDCCTPFSAIYTSFFSKITDDMYMELDRKQTEGMLQELLIGAIPWFEFPKVNIFDYDEDMETFNIHLNNEEITIPRNCVLKFEGGRTANGIIVGTNTMISTCSNYSCMLCDFKGTFSTEIIHAEWFDIIPNGDGTVSNTINQHDKFEKLNISPRDVITVS